MVLTVDQGYNTSRMPISCCLQVRAARSNELLAQQRRVERHMRLQARIVKEQQAVYHSGVQELRKSVSAWKAKIGGYEQLLGNALSLKGIDSCWREAQALKVKLEKQLSEQVEELKATISRGSDAVVAGNVQFVAEHLKSIEGRQQLVCCWVPC